MKRRGWTGCALLVLAAGIAAGCGGGSATPAAKASCPIELPASGAVTLCIPQNGGIAGTLSFAVSGLPNGVTTEITPSTALTEPVSARRTIAVATALQVWAMNVADESSGTNATVTGPSITLTGIANPATVLVEVLDQNGNVGVYTYSGSGGAPGSSRYLPSSNQEADQLLGSCLDQATTCFIDVVSGSLFLPAPTPTFT